MLPKLGGLSTEQEGPIIVTEWRDPLLLSSAFRTAIQRFTRKDRNLYNCKKTEWPAYLASALRSVRRFESSYQAICVKAVNEAELFYEARTKPKEEDDIELCMLLNRYVRYWIASLILANPSELFWAAGRLIH